jgi:aspartyl-tRNA(Asn)/glutamyl-tRNA(Gln) amidotransferase subunit A
MVEECDPPFDVEELRAIWTTLTTVGAARAALASGTWESDATDQIAGLTRQGGSIPAVDYVRAMDRLQAFRGNTSANWGPYDVLLLPTAPAPAWPADLDAPETIGGKPGSGATQGMFCAWVNAMGFAGLSVPGLPHPDGRPIGLQIVAPYGLDGQALEIGRQIEAHAPWAQRWPALAERDA